MILALALEPKRPVTLGKLGQILSSATQLHDGDLRTRPEVIRQLSVDLKSALDESISQPESVAPAFSSLQTCALNPQGAFAVRALCAENAKRLSLARPEILKQAFEDLEHKLTPELRDWVLRASRASD
jgi:hypothetical protein